MEDFKKFDAPEKIKKYFKITPKNFKKVIDDWDEGINRGKTGIFHVSHLSINDIINYAYLKNMIITYEGYNKDIFIIVSFFEKIEEYKIDENE